MAPKNLLVGERDCVFSGLFIHAMPARQTRTKGRFQEWERKRTCYVKQGQVSQNMRRFRWCGAVHAHRWQRWKIVGNSIAVNREGEDIPAILSRYVCMYSIVGSAKSVPRKMLTLILFKSLLYLDLMFLIKFNMRLLGNIVNKCHVNKFMYLL